MAPRDAVASFGGRSDVPAPRNVPGAVSVRQNARFAKYKLASNDVGGEGAAGPHSTVAGGDWRCSVEVNKSLGPSVVVICPGEFAGWELQPHHPSALRMAALRSICREIERPIEASDSDFAGANVVL